jgi:DNA-binding response OmpR family regulator
MSTNTILVIDDDPSFRNITRKIIESTGDQFLEATDIKTTFNLLERTLPDLIILDLNLSEEKGSQILHKRNANSTLKRIPILVCSADNRSGIVKKVMDIGADGYILKPISTKWFLKTIKECLDTRPPLEHVFDPSESKQTIKATVWSEVVGLGEAYCKIRSPIKMKKGLNIEVNFKALKTCISENKTCRVNNESLTQQPGVYNTSCTILGISERLADDIRVLKSRWRQR